jgi:hypothetical protein
VRHTVCPLLLACLGLIISAGFVSAQCPLRSTGYWTSGATVTTPVLVNNCWCVVDFTYCYHPGPPSEYGVASFSPHPGGGLSPGGGACSCSTSPVSILEAVRNWCWFQKECEGWCRNVGDKKTVDVSHAECYRQTTVTPPRWAPCTNSGECKFSYPMTCDESFCKADFATPPTPTSTGPGCSGSTDGCVPICP